MTDPQKRKFLIPGPIIFLLPFILMGLNLIVYDFADTLFRMAKTSSLYSAPLGTSLFALVYIGPSIFLSIFSKIERWQKIALTIMFIALYIPFLFIFNLLGACSFQQNCL